MSAWPATETEKWWLIDETIYRKSQLHCDNQLINKSFIEHKCQIVYLAMLLFFFKLDKHLFESITWISV